MDTIVLSYYDCLLRERDLHTLDEGCWVNDNILSFAFEHLSRTVLADNDRVLLIDPTVTQLLKLSDPDSSHALLDSLQCANRDWILLLVNDSQSRRSSGGSHWSLLVVCPLLERSYHLDPLDSGSNYTGAVTIARQLATYLTNAKLGDVVQLDVAKQQNACDCGPYCLVFTERLCSCILDGKIDRQFADLISPEIHQSARVKRQELVNCIRAMARSSD